MLGRGGRPRAGGVRLQERHALERTRDAAGSRLKILTFP